MKLINETMQIVTAIIMMFMFVVVVYQCFFLGNTLAFVQDGSAVVANSSGLSSVLLLVWSVFCALLASFVVIVPLVDHWLSTLDDDDLGPLNVRLLFQRRIE